MRSNSDNVEYAAFKPILGPSLDLRSGETVAPRQASCSRRLGTAHTTAATAKCRVSARSSFSSGCGSSSSPSIQGGTAKIVVSGREQILLDQSPRLMVVADHNDSHVAWAPTHRIGLIPVHPVGPMPTLPLASVAGTLPARP